MGARQRADLDRHRPDLVGGAAIGAHLVAQDHLAQPVALDVVQDLADVGREVAEPLGVRGLRLVGDAIHFLLAGLLAGNPDRLAQALAVGGVERLLHLGEVGRRQERTLGLAGAGDQIVDAVHDRPHVPHAEVDRRQQVGLAHLTGAALDHDDVGCGARHHHVHVAALELLERRVDHERAVDAPHPDAGDRLRERNVGQAHRGRGSDQREHVGVILLIRRHHGRHDLGLVRELLAEQRAHRTIDQARAEHLLLGRTSFPLEETPGDPAGGVGALAVIDRERDEIATERRSLGGTGGHQHDGVSESNDGGAARQLRHLAGADGERPPTEVQRDHLFHRMFSSLSPAGPAHAEPSIRAHK